MKGAVWLVAFVGAVFLLVAGLGILLFESTFGGSGYAGLFLLLPAVVLLGLLAWGWKRFFPDNWP